MNNKLTDERVSNATLIRLIQWADQHNSHYVAAALCELQERRQADSAKPACYALTNMAGEVYNTHSSAQNAGAYRDLIHQSDDSLTLRVTPLYAVPPASVTGIYDDVLNIIGLLENNEWAEHCTSTVLGSLLESEITRLVSKEQPAQVVPAEMPKGLAGQIVSLLAHNIGDKLLAQKIWNACRAAMLQGAEPVSDRDELPVIGWLRSDYNSDDKRDPNAPLFMLGSNDPSEAWGVKYIPLSGNSPVTPDGWKLAPEKADEDMIAEGNIMASCMIETVGKIDVSLIYGAMLAAAPEKETGPCTK